MSVTRFWLIVLVVTSLAAFIGGVGTMYLLRNGLPGGFALFSSRNVLASAIAHHADEDQDQLIVEPDDGTKPVLNLINTASSSVELVMYEFNDRDIEAALAAAYVRGVQVQVLLNGGYYGVPSKTNPNQSAYDFLTVHHVPVKWTSAAFALTHEKSLVVDNSRALIMTFNFNEPDYARSRDFGLIDNDKRDVQAMRATFDADWQHDTGPPEFGDGLVWSPHADEDLLTVIHGAKKSIDVYNEELADPDILQALIGARERGVSIRLIMTYNSLWKKAFTQLALAGTKVRTYADTVRSPLYIHAKVIVVDDMYVFIGSQNFSPTSLTKSRELGIVLASPAIAKSVTDIFNEDWSSSAADTFLPEPSQAAR